jgi:hypothetical protein
MSTTLKDTPPSQDNSLSDVTVSTPRRILKKMPEMEPLAPDRRYVQPDVSHVSVFTGLFSWALRSNRLGKNAGRRVRLDSQSFGTDGFRAPTGKARGQAKFTNYFALGTEKDLRPRDSGHELNVHRNRVLFLGVLMAMVIYSLVWIAG